MSKESRRTGAQAVGTGLEDRDEIAFTGTIVAKRQSRSRPGWGIVSIETTGVNQKGEPVISFVSVAFVERRKATA